jgi:hypothetical protein
VGRTTPDVFPPPTSIFLLVKHGSIRDERGGSFVKLLFCCLREQEGPWFVITSLRVSVSLSLSLGMEMGAGGS